MKTLGNRVKAIFTRLVGSRFVRDTAILQSGQLASMALSVVTSALIARRLGPDRLGEFYIIFALSSTVSVLDISGALAVTLNRLARAVAANDEVEIRDNLAYYLRVNLQFIAPLMLVLFALLPAISMLRYGDMDIGLWARWITIIAVVDVPNDILSLFYQSRRDMRRVVILETSKLMLVSVTRVISIFARGGVGGLILAQFGVTVLYCLYSIWQYPRAIRADERFPGWPELIGHIPKVKLRERFRAGFYIAIEKNLRNFAEQLPLLALGNENRAAAGFYGAALKVISFPEVLLSSVARNLDTYMPKQAARDTATLRRAFIQSTLYTSAIWSVMAFGVALAAPFVLIGMNSLMYLPAVGVLYPIMLEFLASGYTVSIGATFRTLDKFHYLALVHLLDFALIAPLGFILTNSLGAYGAGWFYGLQALFNSVVVVGLSLWFLRGGREAPAKPADRESKAELAP